MILLTTIHDPHAQLKNDMIKHQEKLKQLFSEIYLCISDKTHDSVIETSTKLFENSLVIKKKGAADARRQVVSYGMLTKRTSRYFLYCDFDRVLTWLETNSRELETLIREIDTGNYDYVILGRTEQAFLSHPVSWQETEKLTNLVASKFLDIGDLDITAGAAIFSKHSANLINKLSIHSYTDCEWAKIIVDSGGKLFSKKVNGLCFQKINVSNVDSHDDYMNRLKLSLNILAVFQ